MISSFLYKHRDFGLLIIRIGIGVAFIFIHGWGKFFGGPERWSKLGEAMGNLGITFYPVFWGFMASVAEFGGGILLILGLFTRTTSAFMAFTMFVATVMHLSKLDPWNKVIYPVELLVVFLGLIFLGAGKYSLDYILFDKKTNT
ncbi:MAG: DoxX family protein [Ignavibacteria bacterium]|nr:DoxX family protein [Ignavibacteria bacterium]